MGAGVSAPHAAEAARRAALRAGSTLPVAEVFATVQGEGPHAGRQAVFVRFMGCNLSCSWCTVPGTMIMRPDFTAVPVDTLSVGDVVLGRTAPAGGKHGRLSPSTVTHVARRRAPLRRVNGGLTVAADTRFWASRNPSAHSGWREVERCEGLACTYLAEPTKRDDADYQWGYLAGMADGDGSFGVARRGLRGYRRFRLALNDAALLARFQRYAAERGYIMRDAVHMHTGFSGPGTMPCLWLTDSVAAEMFYGQVRYTRDSESWAWGYLGGIFDAEGSLSGSVLRISQSPTANPDTYERIAAAAARVGLPTVAEPKGVRVLARGGNLWRFLVNAAPSKAGALAHAVDRAPNNARTIDAVEDAGTGDVVSITTSTGNYVADGWLVHNCDTPYTWDGSRHDLRAGTTHMTVPDLVARVDALDPGGVAAVVLTGGEPLLQAGRPAWRDLLKATALHRRPVHLETNGTVAPSDVWRFEAIAVSPKLGNAGPHRGRQEPVLHEGWAHAARIHTSPFLKIVCVDADDVAAAAELARRLRWPPGQVWVMPEGRDARTLGERWPVIANAAVRRGLNATHRLHVLAWGDERGR